MNIGVLDRVAWQPVEEVDAIVRLSSVSSRQRGLRYSHNERDANAARPPAGVGSRSTSDQSRGGRFSTHAGGTLGPTKPVGKTTHGTREVNAVALNYAQSSRHA